MIFVAAVVLTVFWWGVGFVQGMGFEKKLLQPLIDLHKSHCDEWYGKYMELLRKSL